MTAKPITPIVLETQTGERWAFQPQSDITPLESVLISQLFNKMVLTYWHGPADWPAYVRDHKLERHFTQVGLTIVKQDNDPAIARWPAGGAESVKTVVYVSERKIYDPRGLLAWPAGRRLLLTEGMPVPEGFVLATPENVARIAAEMA